MTGQQFNLNIQDAFQLLKRGNEPKHPDQLERAARLTSSESKEPWGAGGQRRQGSRPTAVFVRAAAVTRLDCSRSAKPSRGRTQNFGRVCGTASPPPRPGPLPTALPKWRSDGGDAVCAGCERRSLGQTGAGPACADPAGASGVAGLSITGRAVRRLSAAWRSCSLPRPRRHPCCDACQGHGPKLLALCGRPSRRARARSSGRG